MGSEKWLLSLTEAASTLASNDVHVLSSPFYIWQVNVFNYVELPKYPACELVGA